MNYRVGILVYDGFDLQDIAAPFHTLAHAVEADGSASFELYTVARTKDIVTCYGGVQILPNHIYPDAEIYDVILVPGGPGYQEALKNLRLMDWINRASRLAQVVAAVSAGVYLLAASRLLNGQTVAAVPGLVEAYPDVQTIAIEAVVRSGKLLTVSANTLGQPLALAIIEALE